MKLLRVKFNASKLTFQNHITDICSEASQKIYDPTVACKLRKLAP